MSKHKINKLKHMVLYNQKKTGPGEMAFWLRADVALVADGGLILGS